MQHKTRDQHLFGSGPKRILALDGGGIRGIVTLRILRRIEAILKERSGAGADFRLCDYFDLIGGTSTAAIIAAGLATGYSVAKLDELYRGLGRHVFKDELFRRGLFRAKFSERPMRELLEREFGDTTLGDDRVRTGLAIMLKRLDTGSPWISVIEQAMMEGAECQAIRHLVGAAVRVPADVCGVDLIRPSTMRREKPQTQHSAR